MSRWMAQPWKACPSSSGLARGDGIGVNPKDLADVLQAQGAEVAAHRHHQVAGLEHLVQLLLAAGVGLGTRNIVRPSAQARKRRWFLRLAQVFLPQKIRLTGSGHPSRRHKPRSQLKSEPKAQPELAPLAGCPRCLESRRPGWPGPKSEAQSTQPGPLFTRKIVAPSKPRMAASLTVLRLGRRPSIMEEFRPALSPSLRSVHQAR